MSIAENKRIAGQFIEALADLSGTSCMALMSDSGTFAWMLRSRSLPLGTQVTKEEFGEVVRSMRSAFPNGVRHEIRDMLAEGDGEVAGVLADLAKRDDLVVLRLDQQPAPKQNQHGTGE